MLGSTHLYRCRHPVVSAYKYAHNTQSIDVPLCAKAGRCWEAAGYVVSIYLFCVWKYTVTPFTLPHFRSWVQISAFMEPPSHPITTLLLSSIWAMKIKPNKILLMHKMRMGKAHSSTWWHSINWWMLNSSLFVPAAALLDWDNMRVPVAGLATSLSVCLCLYVAWL